MPSANILLYSSLFKRASLRLIVGYVPSAKVLGFLRLDVCNPCASIWLRFHQLINTAHRRQGVVAFSTIYIETEVLTFIASSLSKCFAMFSFPPYLSVQNRHFLAC